MTPPQGARAMDATAGPPKGQPGMQPHDPMGEMMGAQQGHEGIAQGATGSMYGQVAGPYDGINRAANGGMEPSPYGDLMAKLVPTLATLLSGGGIGKR